VIIKDKNNKLWTKDFSCITGATILSAIGGEAMNLPISLLVFDETKSTFLSALIMICGMLPDIILPVIIAPFIDRGNKKIWIISLDIFMVFIYAGMGFWTLNHRFNYILYIVFVLVVATNSIIYQLAYSSWYPDLIEKGAEQQGYAVSATIYPLVTIIVSPIVTFAYGKTSIGYIFLFVAALTMVSVILESCITKINISAKDIYNFSQYIEDIKAGFHYLKKEKGIRNIYTYMSITSGATEGVNLITQAYYQTQPWLTVSMLGFLKSAEMIGRVISGSIHYNAEIKRKKRFGFTKIVYLTYDFMDAILLFLPFPLMLANRFICGGLGCGSATIRECAIYSYLPNDIRARVKAIFDVIFSVGGIAFQFIAGALGSILPYRLVALILGITTFISAVIFIVIPGNENRVVYEA
jgi:MFS family permease